MKIISTQGFELVGKLVGFDEAGEDMRFKFAPNIEIEIRKPDKRMIATLTQVGLRGLQNAVIDFETNKIDLTSKKKTSPVISQNQADVSIPVGLK